MFFGIFLNFLAIDPNLGRNIGRNRNVGLRFLIQAVIMRNGTAAKRKKPANKKERTVFICPSRYRRLFNSSLVVTYFFQITAPGVTFQNESGVFMAGPERRTVFPAQSARKFFQIKQQVTKFCHKYDLIRRKGFLFFQFVANITMLLKFNPHSFRLKSASLKNIFVI